MVIDTHHRRTLHRTVMEPKLAAELCEFLESHGHAALALQDTGTAGVDSSGQRRCSTRRCDASLDGGNQRAKVKVVPKMAQQEHRHTVRVGICAMPQQIEAVKQELAARFGQRIVYQNLLVPAYGVEVLEIFDPAVNKWEGVLHLARHHDIRPDQIIAIGDDMNDIPMIQHAGLGVAMGNARPEVQAVAKRIIGANRDEGLAQFLEELVATQTVEPLEEEI